MNKWEYLSVIVNTEKDVSQNYLIITEVNGQSYIIDSVDGKKYRAELHEFLREKGQEGWEVVGLTPLDISTSGVVMESLVIMKRSLM